MTPLGFLVLLFGGIGLLGPGLCPAIARMKGRDFNVWFYIGLSWWAVVGGCIAGLLYLLNEGTLIYMDDSPEHDAGVLAGGLLLLFCALVWALPVFVAVLMPKQRQFSRRQRWESR